MSMQPVVCWLHGKSLCQDSVPSTDRRYVPTKTEILYSGHPADSHGVYSAVRLENPLNAVRVQQLSLSPFPYFLFLRRVQGFSGGITFPTVTV